MQAAALQDDHIPTSVVDMSVSEWTEGLKKKDVSLIYVNPSVKPSVCQLPGRGAFWCGTNSNIKPALKGEVGFA